MGECLEPRTLGATRGDRLGAWQTCQEPRAETAFTAKTAACIGVPLGKPTVGLSRAELVYVMILTVQYLQWKTDLYSALCVS